VIKGNAKAHGIALPFKKPFKRLKPLLPEHNITADTFKKFGFDENMQWRPLPSARHSAAQIEGVGAHDAAHDARSLAHSIYRLG